MWVIEVAEHLVALDLGLVHRAKGRHGLELVEAGLHVPNGCSRGNVLATAEKDIMIRSKIKYEREIKDALHTIGSIKNSVRKSTSFWVKDLKRC